MFVAMQRGMTRRLPVSLLSLLCATACLASPSWASEVSARGAAVSGLHVCDVRQTLSQYCSWRGDKLFLVLPGGLEFELITSIDDPDISNRGDGAFHPFDAAQVNAAYADVRFPLGGIAADVYLLPYPRRGSLESAAGPGLVLLSPGVRPLAVAQQQAEAVHELGHVVQYARLPDSDRQGWDAYRKLRGIEDERVYAPGSPHANRPHEIFAEDFRALFGGAGATTSGTIENAQLEPPLQVSGLDRFLLGLAEPELAASSTLHASPSITHGRVQFQRSRGAPQPLDVYDVAGRPVASLQPVAADGIVTWNWDGRDGRGRAVAPGVWFARTRDGSAATKVTRLP